MASSVDRLIRSHSAAMYSSYIIHGGICFFYIVSRIIFCSGGHGSAHNVPPAGLSSCHGLLRLIAKQFIQTLPQNSAYRTTELDCGVAGTLFDGIYGLPWYSDRPGQFRLCHIQLSPGDFDRYIASHNKITLSILPCATIFVNYILHIFSFILYFVNYIWLLTMIHPNSDSFAELKNEVLVCKIEFRTIWKSKK